jgi:hypothetical protein
MPGDTLQGDQFHHAVSSLYDALTPTAIKKKKTYYPSITNSMEEAEIDRYLDLPIREDGDTKRTGAWIDYCGDPATKTLV